MQYKILITTAGIGSRLGNLTKFVNKSLVSVSAKPIICYQIEKFSIDTEFVIALGYKGNLVKEFLTMAYPERSFEFVEVKNYIGQGSGLGLTIISCENKLQLPFIFMSCDTLVEEKIPPPLTNWMGYSSKNFSESTQYRKVSLHKQEITQISEKEELNTIGFPYIGIAGIYNYKKFWEEMNNGGAEAVEQGESYGLKKLIKDKVKGISYTWHDTGNKEALEEARKFYNSAKTPTILEKENEAIWFINSKVVKFSDDLNFIKNRLKRSEHLTDYIPKILDKGKNMYSYKKASGDVISEIIDIQLFSKLLDFTNKFWKDYKLKEIDKVKFKKDCNNFYRNKTYNRVDLFFTKFDLTDDTTIINGIKIPKLSTLLKEINWSNISDGISSNYHGDFHFENILYDKDLDQFTFLDWRQDFAGEIIYGDKYYDFAKLMHGLIVNHKIIFDELFEAEWKGQNIKFNLKRKEVLIDCEKYFVKWLKENNFQIKKVYILTALIYLNIAPLHHYPYSILLFGLGKSMLYKYLKGKNIYI